MFLAASLIYAVGGVRSLWASHVASDVIQALLVVWAAMCATVVARRSSGHLRQLWSSFAVSVWLLAAGQAMVSYFSMFAHARTATPWPSDVVNFIWVVPAAMMLLPYAGSHQTGINWQRTLDFIQAGIVALMVYLYFFYVPSLWEAEGLRMFRRLMVGIVLRDAILAASFGIRARLTRPSPARRFFSRIAIFFVILGVFEFTSIGQIGQSGIAAEWANASWSIPFLFAVFLAATWNTQQLPDEGLPRAIPGRWVASQALPVLIPIFVILMGHRVALEQLSLAWFAVAASFACSAARLVITNEQQRRIAETLRRTEQALRSTESMISSAFRASPDAISIGLVPEGPIQEINESFVRLTGYSRQEILGKAPEDIGIWVDEDQMRALRARFRQTGELRDAEFRFRRKDGQIRFGLLSGNIVELDGRLYSMLVVRDVTESKQAEDALRASEERFRSLVRDLQVAVVLVRPDGTMQFANPAALEMLGFTPAEMIGKSVADLGIVPVDENGKEFALSERPVARALKTRQPVRGDVMGWRRRGSDEIVWILGNAIPVLAPNGEVDYVITSFADISALRKTQEALRSSEQRFRSLVQILRVGISTWGPDGRLQYVNEALLEMLGTPKTEIVGRKSHEIMRALREDGTEIPPDMRPAARVIATGLP
ncbi:MAG TPA: PAS domain S-box protein, partial [Candidatus Acidoferrales bacterium]|nr:PAS domain S-box protein [Candidatus Acidoferrales bacterium]